MPKTSTHMRGVYNHGPVPRARHRGRGVYVGAAPSVADQVAVLDLAVLDRLIPEHDAFWRNAAQHSPTPELDAFLRQNWRPFFTLWTRERPIVTSDLAAHVVRKATRWLSDLRDIATRNGIPVLDVDPGSIPTIVGVHVGATGIFGTGITASPEVERNEIDSAANALSSALTSQLLAAIHKTPTSMFTAADVIKEGVAQHASDPRFMFYAAQIVPWLAAWRKFVDENSGVWQTAVNAATFLQIPGSLPSLVLPNARERYFALQPFRKSLCDLYVMARKVGFVTPPDPDPPNESIESKMPSTDDLKRYGKYALYGLAGLAGLVGLSVLSNVARR